MSLNGWVILLFGLFASFAFVLGVFSGEVIFIASPKQKSGPAIISFQDYPTWFCILMLLNLVVVLVIWGKFFTWLRRRKNQEEDNSFSSKTLSPSCHRTASGGR